jgi:hypothetical protein
MKSFDIKENILKFISANPKGVNIESIIDFLDYINKVRYKKVNIEAILMELVREKKISSSGNLWIKS